LKREVTIHLPAIFEHADFEFRDTLKWWADATRRKAKRWGQVGDSFFHKTGRWSHLIRIFDKTTDIYYERIIDSATGEVILQREGKLTEHRGHGSAKKKNLRDP
jgi:hypothetical protein